MEFRHLGTSPLLIPSRGRELVVPAGLRNVPGSRTGSAVGVAQGHYNGLNWVHRVGAERVLQALTAADLSDAAAAGWQKIKSNTSREVWRGEIAGRGHYLKYYFADTWVRRLRDFLRVAPCASEWSGGIYAIRNGIPAVLPVGYTTSLRRDGRPSTVLVTEAVSPAYPLQDFWRQVQADPDAKRRYWDRNQIFERLAELIARAHQAGFEHTDMHSANILVQPTAPGEYRCVFVDLHSARIGVSISDRAVVRNLAQLNQWFRKHASISERLRFLRSYLRWRDSFEYLFTFARPLELSFEELLAALADEADRHAQALWAQRDRRDGRDGRYFGRVRVGGGWRGNVYRKTKHPAADSPVSKLALDSAWWKSQWKKIDAAFLSADATVCKESHSARVVRVALDHSGAPVQVIVKQPKARNWRRALSQVFSPSRSRRAWHTGNALLHRDVPTARPLGVFEKKVGPWVVESRFVTEALPFAMDLESYLVSMQPRCHAHEWAGLKRELCDRMVRLMRLTFDRHVEHRDCKAGNILVVDKPELRVMWIDLDGVRVRTSPIGQRAIDTALARLHVSLLRIPGLTRTDRARFLREFCARFGARADAWREAYRRLAPQVNEKIAASVKRREWKMKHYGRH